MLLKFHYYYLMYNFFGGSYNNIEWQADIDNLWIRIFYGQTSVIKYRF